MPDLPQAGTVSAARLAVCCGAVFSVLQIGCNELVLRGLLYLARNALFDLSVTQAQDCTRSGGTVDTFTTTKSGGFTIDGTHLVLHPSGTGIQLTGTTSSATVDLQLPQLPLLGAEARSGTFIISPR